jgi:hypothetical protein
MSTFVLMEVETLGVARSLGWKVHMRCANGYQWLSQEHQVHAAAAFYRKQLDLESLACTARPEIPTLKARDAPHGSRYLPVR